MKSNSNERNYQELFHDEPWNEDVEPKVLFEKLRQLIESSVRLSEHEAVAAALVGFSHLLHPKTKRCAGL
jgi:hypothetical protein